MPTISNRPEPEFRRELLEFVNSLLERIIELEGETESLQNQITNIETEVEDLKFQQSTKTNF
jgi:predicted  nucleic acid-binding Zn-ribbon protein